MKDCPFCYDNIKDRKKEEGTTTAAEENPQINVNGKKVEKKGKDPMTVNVNVEQPEKGEGVREARSVGLGQRGRARELERSEVVDVSRGC